MFCSCEANTVQSPGTMTWRYVYGSSYCSSWRITAWRKHSGRRYFCLLSFTPTVGSSLQAGYKPASNCYHLTPIWILANKHRKCCCRQFQPERIFLVASDELEHRETAKLCALYESRTGSRTEPEGKLLKKVHISYTSPVLQSCELKWNCRLWSEGGSRSPDWPTTADLCKLSVTATSYR